MKNSCLIFLLLISSSTIFALPGDLDMTFGVSGGYVVSDFLAAQVDERANDVAVQTDGKIIAIGSQERSSNPGDNAVCTQRFNADGAIDTSLNFTANDGTKKQTVLSAQEFTSVEAITGLPNGKILVAGWGEVPNQTYNRAKLIRLNANGTLDTSFMDEGIFEYANSSTSTYFNDLKILSDGSFLVAGEAGIPLGGIVAKFTPAGIPDTTFSGDGVFTSNAITQIYGVAVQTDGKIIGCGSNGSGGVSNDGAGNRFGTAKLNANGTLRLGWGTLGRTISVFPNDDAKINTLGLNWDGKILAAGSTWNGTDYDFAIARYQNEAGVTAANVAVSGRVSTAKGSGIRNIIVTLTDTNGNRLTTKTNSFGHFRFDEIAVGQTYVVTVSSKRFAFENPTQVLNVSEELSDVDFIAFE